MITTAIQSHYSAPDLMTRIVQGLQTMGKDRHSFTLDDLALVDEFHVRGAAATADLIQLLAPTAQMHVLDLGSGLGGPARRLAQTSGCSVTGIDLSESYCTTAATLTQWCGLDQQVRFQRGNVSDLSVFQAGTFDAAWTIHVGMNVPDKTTFYQEVYRVLKPGAAFVIYEVFTTGGQHINFPVPWAQTQESSFLLTLDEGQAHLAEAGFGAITVHDWTEAGTAFLNNSVARFAQQTAPPPLGLHLLLGPVFRTMFQALHQNFVEQRLQLAAICCVKRT